MKTSLRILAALAVLLLLAGCSAAPASTTSTTGTIPTTPLEPKPEGIQNIILIIGDGTGDEQLEAGELAFGKTFCFREWAHTHANTDSLYSDGTPGNLTDSAAGGTALATGQLTSNGRVAQPYDSNTQLKTILDYAKEYGKATGVVTTDTMSGATPAAFSGHADNRSETLTILHSQLDSNIDLLCANFSSEASNMKGIIEDAGYAFADFSYKIPNTMDSEKVYWLANLANSNAPDKLEKIVPNALEFLSKDPDGFVLMIEQGHVDKYCHSNEIDGATICANSLNNTVEAVLEWCAGRDDTAIFITADHETGGLSVSAEADFPRSYTSKEGNTLYYQWTSTGHTATPVSVYVYGFTPDFATYSMDGNPELIKNTAVFQMMLSLLEDPLQ